MDCSPPGSSVHGILQARILEWVAISFSWGSSGPRGWTQVCLIAGRFVIVWATRETTSKSCVFITKVHFIDLKDKLWRFCFCEMHLIDFMLYHTMREEISIWSLFSSEAVGRLCMDINLPGKRQLCHPSPAPQPGCIRRWLCLEKGSGCEVPRVPSLALYSGHLWQAPTTWASVLICERSEHGEISSSYFREVL